MKKLLFALFVLTTFQSFGQTILASHPLELKKPRDNQQLLNAVNLRKDIFTFVADKEKMTILKYNKFVFFSDSLTIKQGNDEYENLAGYSFENNGNLCVYWSNESFTKLKSVMFDFENRTNRLDNFTFDFTDETILNTFSENNFFYILTLPKGQDLLKFYALRKGELYQKSVDFSKFKFADGKGKTIAFNQLIRENGLEMIDTKSVNPLFQTVGKSKMYIDRNKMVLTFDSTAQTQIFQIDLNSFSVIEQTIPQQMLVKSGKSNSYFHQNKLYQVKVNDEELAVSAVDLTSGNVLKKYYAEAKDEISFRNSPLLSQTGRQAGREMKTTKKFLQRLNSSEIGISVYQTPHETMLTVGGIRNVNSTGSILLGITAGAAMVATGTGADVSDMFDAQDLQSTYFEVLFDDKFEHQKVEQLPLAIDGISQFLSENNFTLQSVLPFENYFIVTYYDTKKKELVMRRFEDASDF